MVLTVSLSFSVFLGGWKQELFMILSQCPYLPDQNEAMFATMFDKKLDTFQAIYRRIIKLIKGEIELSKVRKALFQMTKVSLEVIQHGFAPFDINLQSGTELKDFHKQGRENLKKLLKWLFEELTSDKPLPEGFDPLQGRDPYYYGLTNSKSRLNFYSHTIVAKNYQFVDFKGGWRQELAMILLQCPDFRKKHELKLEEAIASGPNFNKTKGVLKSILNKDTERPKTADQVYKATNVSEEVIQNGFEPFDWRDQPSKQPSQSESRENLKDLILWICQVVTPNKDSSHIDPLRGKRPSFYGLSEGESKFVFFPYFFFHFLKKNSVFSKLFAKNGLFATRPPFLNC